jgi:malonate transporter
MLHVIIMTLAPIFFITMLGPLAERIRAIDDHHVGELNALVIDFALPAFLFVATASSSRSEMMAQGPLFAMLGAVTLGSITILIHFGRQVSQASVDTDALWARTVGAQLRDCRAAGKDRRPVLTGEAL